MLSEANKMMHEVQTERREETNSACITFGEGRCTQEKKLDIWKKV